MDAARKAKFLSEKHAQYTKSQKAISVLTNWDEMMPKFVKLMPRDYKRVLQAIQNALALGLSGDDALNAAFEENSHVRLPHSTLQIPIVMTSINL